MVVLVVVVVEDQEVVVVLVVTEEDQKCIVQPVRIVEMDVKSPLNLPVINPFTVMTVLGVIQEVRVVVEIENLEEDLVDAVLVVEEEIEDLVVVEITKDECIRLPAQNAEEDAKFLLSQLEKNRFTVMRVLGVVVNPLRYKNLK